MGHALANIASQGILSEKLRFSCFSQVPAGSDYPSFRPILHKKLYTYYYKFDFTLNEYEKITYINTISYILLKMYFSTITATPSSSLLSVTSSAISKTCFWELAMAMPFPAY